jgi:tetratricopeptide (TPR) repeat protein
MAMILGPLVAPWNAFCDVIYLQNGRELKGTVLARTDGNVTVKSHSGAILTLPEQQVVRVERESPAQVLADQVAALVRVDRLDDALALLDKEISTHPGDRALVRFRADIESTRFEKRLSDAQAMLGRGNFDGAVRLALPLFQEAPRGPTRDRVHAWLAEAYYERAKDQIDHIRYSAGSETLSQAVQAGISDPRIHVLIAQMHERQGRITLAGNEYQMALVLDPSSAEARTGLAKCRALVEKLGLAKLDELDKARDMVALGEEAEARVHRMTPSPAVRREMPRELSTAISATDYSRIGKYVSDSSHKYDRFVEEAARTHNVDVAWIKAIIMAESSFSASAKSPVGAKGLMQLMDATAGELGVTDPLDPRQNIMAGTRYFRQMLDQFDQDPILALAAYNAGANTVVIYKGIPPYKETQNYVRKVALFYQYFAYEQAPGH